MKTKRVSHRGQRHVQRVPGGANDYQKAEDASLLPRNTVEAVEVAGADHEKRRRFVRGEPGHISRKPHLDAMLSSAYITCWEVLQRIQRQARHTEGNLDEIELRAFTRIAGDVLPKLIREEREQQKQERLDEMELSDLLELADEAKKVLTDDAEIVEDDE